MISIVSQSCSSQQYMEEQIGRLNKLASLTTRGKQNWGSLTSKTWKQCWQTKSINSLT